MSCDIFLLRLFGWKMGFEPTTLGTTILYSNQLSYIHRVDLSPNRCANIRTFFVSPKFYVFIFSKLSKLLRSAHHNLADNKKNSRNARIHIGKSRRSRPSVHPTRLLTATLCSAATALCRTLVVARSLRLVCRLGVVHCRSLRCLVLSFHSRKN